MPTVRTTADDRARPAARRRDCGDEQRPSGAAGPLEALDEPELAVEGRTFAQYWHDRPGQMRTTLRRKAKKVSVAIYDAFDETAWNAYREHA